MLQLKTLTDVLAQQLVSVEEAAANIDLAFITTNASSCTAMDGSIIVNASGGAPPYSYLWDDGTTSDTLSGINAGIYFVTVTDSNDCPVVGVGQLVNGQ